MIARVTGLSRSEAANQLQVSRKTLVSWTQRGIINASTWTSPGGRIYVGYPQPEIDRLKNEMGIERDGQP